MIDFSFPDPPKFDRVAVADMRIFARIPKSDPKPSLTESVPAALAGIPVVIDENLEVGVLELRNGDVVYSRMIFTELRA